MENKIYYDDNITVEWINDVKYMSPSPHPNHGRVYIELFGILYNYLKNKKCKLFPDKTDLCLSDIDVPIKIKDLKKPVVPDLFIICENNFELVGNTIVGIPDFICEILSPGTRKIDTTVKRALYLSKGIKEYWLIDYIDKSIVVIYNGTESKYNFDDEVKVNIFDDLTICLKDVELFEV